jgi:predicted YcjX-like family ATPase
LRLTFEWDGEDFARQMFGMRQRLHVDIIDYPGEWLIDLGLMRQTYAEWAGEALGYARSTRVPEAARPFLDFIEGLDPAGAEDEAIAMRGAELFTAYLREAKRTEPSRAILGPGRFLLPGDLEGSPLVTFFPMELNEQARPHTLGALLNRRFESYKTHVVEPFFKQHFSRLDRQIVLIDMLTSLNGGAQGLNDLEHGLEGVLRAFRPGRNSWLSLILPKRIDRIAFAATKADHIHKFSHGRLAAILEKAVARAARRASDAQAETAFFALAGLKSTIDVEKSSGSASYRCVRGVPEKGEKLGRETFDGVKEAVVFPGDLPDDPLDAFDPERATVGQYSFLRFEPPRMEAESDPWPHVGLERAVTFLFGDYLP